MRSSATTTATFCATLVDEWLQCGVRHAIICPGSRSTPLAVALADRTELELHIFHDERSAAFAALGIGKASKKPAILLCTSGTAAVEFHAAVVEADHARVPILVCTADRPPELQNVGAPQTINQQNLYGESVRNFINAPVAVDREKNQWRTLARNAWYSSLGANLDKSTGPVHVNLQFREPLIGISDELPKQLKPITDQIIRANSFRKIDLITRRRLSRLIKKRRVLIIAGADVSDASGLLQLANKMKWPVLADPRSGARVEDNKVVISAMDSMLRDEQFANSQKPEVILRFGEPLVSKVVNSWLAATKATQVVVTSTPVLIDPEQMTKLHIVSDLSAISNWVLKFVSSQDSAWMKSWSDAEEKAQHAINSSLADELSLSEPAIARAVCRSIPEHSNLFVSSSMPIRDVEWFAAPRSGLRVYANRGVNGIDGVISTAVGVALSSRATTFLLIGDLAFLHDSNALINLISRDVDLRIVLIDNCGGGIFSFLPQAALIDSAKFEKVFGTPHNADLLLLAKAHGLETTSVSTLDQLLDALVIRGPQLIRIATDRSENVRVHERINQMVSVAIHINQ
jgi:2-succinyl-5-enolpyruvyl-6-hydroxy-3-cyclohexene-1-carboxylate synthase